MIGTFGMSPASPSLAAPFAEGFGLGDSAPTGETETAGVATERAADPPGAVVAVAVIAAIAAVAAVAAVGDGGPVAGTRCGLGLLGWTWAT